MQLGALALPSLLPMRIPCDISRVLLRLISSEVFWTALGAIGGVVGLYLIFRQLANASNVTAYEFVRKEDDRFRSQELQDDRSRLARVLLASPKDYLRIDEVADNVLDYFEDLGVLVRRRIADPYFVWATGAYYIVRYWEALKDYVEWVRREMKDPTYHEEFEYLYRRVALLEQKSRMTKGLRLQAKEIRRFLEEELHLHIRPFRVSDLDRIVEIERVSFSSGEAYTRSTFEDLLQEHPDSFQVAECIGEIVGYIIAYVSDRGGEIDSVAVALGFRRLGVGRKLVEAAVLQCEASGVKVCVLETRTTNTLSIRLFEGLGFRTVRTMKGYYGEGIDAYEMRREIKKQ